MQVFLRQTRGTATEDGGRLIAEAVARVAGSAAADVALSVRCPRCGSTRHGKPDVVAPLFPGGRPFQASLSRTRGLTAVAVGTGAPIGLDIERMSLVARAPIDAALHPDESAALDLLPDGAREERRATLWTAKEAVLKATGHGLNVDPSMLALDVAADGAVELIGWPDVLGLGSAPPINIFRPDADVIGALAVLAPNMPETRFEWLPPAHGSSPD